MVRRVILCLALLAVFAALLAGCGAAGGNIIGKWYEETGYFGSIEFKEGGIATVIINDDPTDCTYTYDALTGQGTLTFEDATSTITVNGDKLTIDGAVYTKKEVTQKDIDKLIEDIKNSSKSASPTATAES